MIKIDKDLTAIPTSLKPATADYFPPPSRPSRPSRTTHERRQELIDHGAYIDSNKYNSRYKWQDVKDGLHTIYHKKCAFCEQRSEVPHVEHFRPKKIYHWLAYSWDNLLLACSACNSSKGDRFYINGIRHTFVFTATTYRTIHENCVSLDRTEQPLLVNPEIEDLASELIFEKDGGVRSDHVRVAHTIKECSLSRDDLKYQRKKLLDDFRKDVEATLLENTDDPAQQNADIEAFVKQFLRRMNSAEESFLAFRKYTVAKGWLANIVKTLN